MPKKTCPTPTCRHPRRRCGRLQPPHGRDDVGTLSALKSRQVDILQPAVSKHHGRIVKLMGDGVLVEFASAVNAVTCAVELQQAMESANQGDLKERYRPAKL